MNRYVRDALLVLALSLPLALPIKATAMIPATDTTYVMIEVMGLSCPFCAYGLEKKLKEINGVADIEINVKEAFATFQVTGDPKPTEKQLRQVVKDAGFTAGNIRFSTDPFVTAAKKEGR